MGRKSTYCHVNGHLLEMTGLNPMLISDSVAYAHDLIDQIDDKLVEVGAGRLTQMVELANLSAIVGNLLGAGIARNSDGAFKRNGPHKYPDLLAQREAVQDIEIKVALGKNAPKSHLAKEGPHLICRYVLAQEDLTYRLGERGNRVAIWELRFGNLLREHYNVSNTDGDSGKTAVVNAAGMTALQTVYFDISLCPYAPTSRTYRKYADLISSS